MTRQYNKKDARSVSTEASVRRLSSLLAPPNLLDVTPQHLPVRSPNHLACVSIHSCCHSSPPLTPESIIDDCLVTTLHPQESLLDCEHHTILQPTYFPQPLIASHYPRLHCSGDDAILHLHRGLHTSLLLILKQHRRRGRGHGRGGITDRA